VRSIFAFKIPIRKTSFFLEGIIRQVVNLIFNFLFFISTADDILQNKWKKSITTVKIFRFYFNCRICTLHVYYVALHVCCLRLP
jgi:hypothetical protein